MVEDEVIVIMGQFIFGVYLIFGELVIGVVVFGEGVIIFGGFFYEFRVCLLQ